MSRSAKAKVLKVATALGGTLLGVLLALTPWGRDADLVTYDYLFQLRGDRAAPADIVIIAIDEPTFAVTRARWPWPRSMHADILDRVHADGARVMAVDLLFAEPSDPQEDAALARALGAWERIVLASEFSVVRDKQTTHELTVEPFAALGAPRTGFVNLPLDSDGTVRRAALHRGDRNSFAANVAGLAAPGDTAGAGATGGGIDFPGPPRTIRTVSAYQVLEKAHLPDGFFRDKIVFLGMASSTTISADDAVPDHYATPFTRHDAGLSSGVEIHAAATDTLLRGRMIRLMPDTRGLGIGALCALFLSLGWYRWSPARGALAATGAIGLLAASCLLLFTHGGIYVPLPALVLPVLGAFAGSPFVHYWLVHRERAFIRRAFSSYVAQSVVDRMLADPDQLRLGGEAVEATALFTDMAGFTTIGEQLEPRELINLLNEHLGALSDLVITNEGTMGRFAGDAVMAIWGAPWPQRDHAARACRAALAMAVHAAREAEVARRAGVQEVQVRIGVNSGPMIAGNVGGHRFFNYTVVGDDVNLAARLEGINKLYGTTIIIGEHTRALLGPEFVVRELDLVQVVGQRTPTRIFELQSGDNDPERFEKLNRGYATALDQYRSGAFGEAASAFSALADALGDPAAARMHARCVTYTAQPPDADWDGVFVARQK